MLHNCKTYYLASLFQDLARSRMHLFVSDFAGLPVTAKSFHQKDGADHLLAEQLRR